MDPSDIARLQFAGTTSIHWLFVLLTLGLAPLVAVLHTWAALSRDPVRAAERERMTRFWGQLYLVNYAVGIVTGLVMEFQFGLNWSGLSDMAGSVFGAPLALETLIAFFAESTFLGMWVFGWGRLPRAVHVALIWLVALTAYVSAYWILVANGYLQNPTGTEVRDGVARITDFGALLTNPSALVALAHITLAAAMAGGLFLAGVSAFRCARHPRDRAAFRGSLRLGLLVAAPASWFVVDVGNQQWPILGATQPMKLAALEGEGTGPLQAMLVRRHGPGDYVPPSWIELPMTVMTNIGYTLSIVTLVAFALLWKDLLVRFRPLAYLVTALVPLPFVASLGGWVFREVGRQPWLIYGQLTVEDAVSDVSATALTVSCAAFLTLFVALAVLNWALIVRYVRRGPADVQLGASEPPLPTEPGGDGDRHTAATY